jgi:hypothetical protein
MSDPFYIVRESLMNFEKGCKIALGNKIGTVESVDKAMIYASFEDGTIDYIRYSELRIVDYKPMENNARLTNEDKQYIFDNQDKPTATLARTTGKSFDKIEKFRASLKPNI